MPDRKDEPTLPVYTVGHSNHEMETFLALLKMHGVEVVTDVRSSPYSRYASQYNRETFRQSLIDAGFRYVYLGEELGGRPASREFYDEDGHVLYSKVVESGAFTAGIERLARGIAQYRVAMLCSEEDPTHCHRRRLISRVLVERGFSVQHIRGNGSIESELELRVKTGDDPNAPKQESLFEGEGGTEWRSTQSVTPARPPRSSLESFEMLASEES